MSQFKPIFVGEDHEMCFVCERCQIADQEAVTYDTYNRPMRTLLRQPGQCVSCDGTGMLPGTNGLLCAECSGTGICPECEGQYARDWADLSDEVKAVWVKWREEHANELDSYGTVASFYRKW